MARALPGYSSQLWGIFPHHTLLIPPSFMKGEVPEIVEPKMVFSKVGQDFKTIEVDIARIFLMVEFGS